MNKDQRPVDDRPQDDDNQKYEKPEIVYRGRLEAYASVCSQKASCTAASS